MKTSTFALIVGIAYLGLGVLGLIPAALVPPPAEAPSPQVSLLYGYLLGLFPVNILHTALNLAIGAWGISAARGGANPLTFSRLVAMLFGALAVLGMMPGLNTLFGWMPLHGHDVWLHAATAVLAAYFGWRTEGLRSERRGVIHDRRYEMRPVMRERRAGMVDRRLAAGA